MRECIEFEKKYGNIVFIKLCGSALNKLLVDKGLITKKELQKYFLKEVKNYRRTKWQIKNF